MVDVAQLVESRIVIPAVAGSSPVVHPIFLNGPLAQLVEQLTLNQLVVGSTPTRPTISKRRVARVAKLVDAQVLEACGVTRESSSLSFRTNFLDFEDGVSCSLR
jgi:hypothetical protein